MKHSVFIWDSEVRGYELDMQGIVNNANYFHYFDHVRILQFFSIGIDWADWHRKGFNLVLIHIDLSIKSSLMAHDKFYITSEIERSGKLKLLFIQKIYRKQDNKLIAHAINTIVCVSTKTNKPVMPKELETLLCQQMT